jgi:hypothetical protein
MRLVAAAALAVACAGSSRGPDAYPAGDSRFDVAFSGTHLGTVRFEQAGQLDADARAALDDLDADARRGAVGYDAYQVYRDRGHGYATRRCEYRDYVFFDAGDRIVGSTRRFVRC